MSAGLNTAAKQPTEGIPTRVSGHNLPCQVSSALHGTKSRRSPRRPLRPSPWPRSPTRGPSAASPRPRWLGARPINQRRLLPSRFLPKPLPPAPASPHSCRDSGCKWGHSSGVVTAHGTGTGRCCAVLFGFIIKYSLGGGTEGHEDRDHPLQPGPEP